MSKPVYTNRLIHEKSPYLLQHAHNPVDWYPWGEEAFRAAKEEDKPIFLSIGYATCHWCHVMEQESFQNPELAAMMNEAFINVKVDREEKPEIDSLYMELAQAMMSGGVGWPLNLVLTPELTPFFAATYLPADATRGYLGMKQLIQRIREIWSNIEERENVILQAGKIVDVFAENISTEGRELPDESVILEAAELLYQTADPIYGGTKGSPKFPIGIQACFLLHLVRKTGDSRALFYVERTLDMMHRGGIYDHIGGGFARYTIDEQWRIPHFEKMLYDNAILARVYLETWQYTHHEQHREVSEEILNYLLRDMRDPRGGFFSAEDADTEGAEGRYYTWTWEEMQVHLGKHAPLFCDFYSVTPGGNFEGRNVLFCERSLQDFARYRNVNPTQLKDALTELRMLLWEVREKRIHPEKDDKVITAWNGLAIHAFAEAGRAFYKPKFLDAAEQAAAFIHKHLWHEGTLLRRWRDNEARFDGCLDDYAFMIQGLLSLFEADRGSRWLSFALELNDALNEEFKAEHGAYFHTNGRDANLILRRQEFYDGAEPSGSAVQAENLIRLFQITGVDSYLDQAGDVLKAAQEHIDLYPPGATYHLMALQRYLDKQAPTLIISLNNEETHREEIAKMLAGQYIPHKAIVWARESDEELRDFAPAIRGKMPLRGETTLYICYPDRCEEPITDLSKMWERMDKI